MNTGTDRIRLYPGAESAFVQVPPDWIEPIELRLANGAGAIQPGEAITYLGGPDGHELHAPINKTGGTHLTYAGIVRANGDEIACFIPEPATNLPGWYSAYVANDLLNPGALSFPHQDGRTRYVQTDTVTKAS